MKKWIIISIVLVIIAITGSILTKNSLSTVEKLGHNLLTMDTISDWRSNRNSPIEGIVNIGSDLYDILKNHKVPINQINVESQLCDCLNSSLSITHSIVITSPKGRLCIRLRYAPTLSKYHIFGFSGTIE